MYYMNRFIKHLLVMLPLAATLTACDQLKDIVPSLTDAERVQGLKETLIVGTDTASTKISRVNGYFADQAIKILLPPEALRVRNTIASLPGGNALLDRLEQQLNRSAEEAAKRSLPIFTNAITSMSISDAAGIIAGADSAATNYLRRTTYQPLTNAYQPVVDSVLRQPLLFNTSAQDTWNGITSLYNAVPYVTPLNTNLAGYTTERALHGLFIKVRDQEKEIRQNPQKQVTEAIRKIFKK